LGIDSVEFCGSSRASAMGGRLGVIVIERRDRFDFVVLRKRTAGLRSPLKLKAARMGKANQRASLDRGGR
jgi:hypothetical protein